MEMMAKYVHLLGNADVRHLFDNLSTKFVVTATVYLRTLWFYCDLSKTDPKAFLKVARTKAFSGLRPEFIGNYEGSDGLRL